MNRTRLTESIVVALATTRRLNRVRAALAALGIHRARSATTARRTSRMRPVSASRRDVSSLAWWRTEAIRAPSPQSAIPLETQSLPRSRASGTRPGADVLHPIGPRRRPVAAPQLGACYRLESVEQKDPSEAHVLARTASGGPWIDWIDVLDEDRSSARPVAAPQLGSIGGVLHRQQQESIDIDEASAIAAHLPGRANHVGPRFGPVGPPQLPVERDLRCDEVEDPVRNGHPEGKRTRSRVDVLHHVGARRRPIASPQLVAERTICGEVQRGSVDDQIVRRAEVAHDPRGSRSGAVGAPELAVRGEENGVAKVLKLLRGAPRVPRNDVAHERRPRGRPVAAPEFLACRRRVPVEEQRVVLA